MKKKKSSQKSWKYIVLVPVSCLVVAFGVGLGSRMLASEPAVSSQAAAEERCDGYCVDIKGGVATPDSVSVPVGSYVQFNNADGGQYNLALGRGNDAHAHGGDESAADSDHDHDKRFISGDINEGEAWRVQLKKAGTFHFHDHYDPDLSILVVAYEPGAEYKVE